MILKAIDTQDNEAVRFIDGAVSIDIKTMRVDEANNDSKWVNVLTTCLYDSEVLQPDLHIVIRCVLQKEDGSIFRIIYFGSKYQLYLLNDSGKTIERIN
jgi:hypothetical protein